METSPRMNVGRLAGALIAALALLMAAAPAAGATPTQVVVAGYDYYSELGNGEGLEYLSNLEVAPFWGTQAVQAAAADYNNYAVLANGTVEAAGYNAYGNDGLGFASPANYLPKVIPGLSGVTEVAAGDDYFALALLSNGTVDSWGYGTDGELGNGKKEAAAEENSPTPIAGLEHVTQVVAGCYYGMALLSNGTVETWGHNEYGELGDGGTTETTTPQVVPGLTNVVAIASGCYTSYALLSNGKVMAWGRGEYGQLGNGTNTAKQSTPVEVKGVERATQISAGYFSGYALLSGGAVKAWGRNGEGELGDGTNTEHTEPELIPGLTGVVRITAASQTAYATLANGTVDGWGSGFYGELGNGRKETAAEEKSPTPIAGLADVISIAKGDYDYSLMAIEGASATLSTTSLAFPSEAVGQTSPAESVTLKNEGPASLAVSGYTLSGSGASAFIKSADTCSGSTLAAGASCAVTFTFKPGAVGAASASLAFTTSAVNALPAVSLSGTGTTPPPKPVGIAKAARLAIVKAGTALVKLTCSGLGACGGSLKLVARAVEKRNGKRHLRNVVIGTAAFSIAEGKGGTLRVHLSAKGRALLRRAGKRGLEVTVKGSGVKTGTVVLKKARKRKRKH
jgi:alpha-tubulin suppressor-like RCC1 family protein